MKINKMARAKLEAIRPKQPEYVGKLEKAAFRTDADWIYLTGPALMAIWSEHAPERVPVVLQGLTKFDGRHLWRQLHLRPGQVKGYPANETEFLTAFERRVPCGECRSHWREITNANPPATMTAADYFAWTVKVHNEVNRLLGKPEVSEAEARQAWKVA